MMRKGGRHARGKRFALDPPSHGYKTRHANLPQSRNEIELSFQNDLREVWPAILGIDAPRIEVNDRAFPELYGDPSFVCAAAAPDYYKIVATSTLKNIPKADRQAILLHEAAHVIKSGDMTPGLLRNLRDRAESWTQNYYPTQTRLMSNGPLKQLTFACRQVLKEAAQAVLSKRIRKDEFLADQDAAFLLGDTRPVIDAIERTVEPSSEDDDEDSIRPRNKLIRLLVDDLAANPPDAERIKRLIRLDETTFQPLRRDNETVSASRRREPPTTQTDPPAPASESVATALDRTTSHRAAPSLNR